MEFCVVQARAGGGEPFDANECRDGKENLGKDQDGTRERKGNKQGKKS